MADKSEKSAEFRAKRKAKTQAVKNAVKSAVSKGKQNPNTVTSNRLELLVAVVNRNKAEYYVDLIQSFEVNMQIIAHATGTADEKMLSLLGLSDTEKAAIFGIIQQEKIPSAMRVIEEKFKTIKGGNGIAFTIPLTSIIGKLIFGFLSNNKMTVQESK